MAIEAEQTVLVSKTARVVRGHLIRRWADYGKASKVMARVVSGAMATVSLATLDPAGLINAYEIATSLASDVDFDKSGAEVFQVEIEGIVWRYRLTAVDDQTTRVEMLYAITSFVARMPGARSLARTAVKNECARLERWGARPD